MMGQNSPELATATSENQIENFLLGFEIFSQCTPPPLFSGLRMHSTWSLAGFTPFAKHPSGESTISKN